MLDTSARLLRLLSLFQSRRDWNGAELAERLDVTPRTVRRDVDRLRELGYPVRARPGVAGGYRLGAGTTLPPLLLDDDEAVAVAVGLRSAAAGTVTGLQEASVRALVKLEQVLPARLRHHLTTVQEATVALPPGGPAVDRSALTLLAAACHGREQVRFTYVDRSGARSERDVQPHRLVHTGRHWYLVARDLAAAAEGAAAHDAWRSFRVDRMSGARPTGRRFRPVDPPDAVAFVRRGITTAPYRYQLRALLRAPAPAVAERIPATVGTVEAVDEHSCLLVTGSDSLDGLALHVGLLGVEVEVLEPPELREHLRSLAARLTRAAGPAPGPTPGPAPRGPGPPEAAGQSLVTR